MIDIVKFKMNYFSAIFAITESIRSICDLMKSPQFQNTVKIVGDSVANVCTAATSVTKESKSLESNILQEISKISSDISELQTLLVQSFEDLKSEIKFEFENQAVKSQETLIAVLFAQSMKYAANFDSFHRSTISDFIKESTKVDIIIDTYYLNVFQGDESYFDQVTNRILKAEKKFESNFDTPLQVVLLKFYQSILLVQIKAFFLDSFAYIARTKLGEGNFYKEYAAASEDFELRIRESTALMNRNLKNAVRWQCNTEIKEAEVIAFRSNNFDNICYTPGGGEIFLLASTQESKSNVTENYVISGVRLVKIKYVVHVAIQESKLLANGFIDKNTSRWLLPENGSWGQIFRTDRVPVNLMGLLLKPKIRVDEATFIESKTMTELNDDYVLTGVQVLNIHGDTSFQAKFHKFNRKTGKLNELETKTMKTDVLIPRDVGNITSWISESNRVVENPLLDIRTVCSSTTALTGIAIKVSQVNDQQVSFGLQIKTLPIHVDFELCINDRK